jgi:archaellum biogenesis ATPase FlaH
MKRPTEVDALVAHFGYRDAVKEAEGGWWSSCPVVLDNHGGPVYCGEPMFVKRLEDGSLRYELVCGHSQEEAAAALLPLSEEVPGANPLGSGAGTPRYAGRKLDMSALLGEPDEPIPWRCHGITADGYLTTIAGRGGEGKSWLTLALAHGVHAGGIVAGIPCTGGTAIVFDAENGAELLKRRFRAGGIAAGTVQPYDADGLHIVKDIAWFKGEIESEGANLAIFDSLRILSSGADENDTEEIEPIMSALRRLARETSAAIVLVHHRGRDDTSSYRGSSAIRDGTDMLFKFGRVKDDPEGRHRRVLETVKCRIDEEPEPRWLRIEGDRAAGLVYVDEAEPYEGGTGGATVRAGLADELLGLLGEKPRTLASVAREVGRDPKDGTVRRALGALVEAGRVERTESGWRRVPVPRPKGLAPGTPDSKAESGNGHQPELEEYAEAEIDRLREKWGDS